MINPHNELISTPKGLFNKILYHEFYARNQTLSHLVSNIYGVINPTLELTAFDTSRLKIDVRQELMIET